jgi:hypothetical protein
MSSAGTGHREASRRPYPYEKKTWIFIRYSDIHPIMLLAPHIVTILTPPALFSYPAQSVDELPLAVAC